MAKWFDPTRIDEYEQTDWSKVRDFHSVVTITLCELLDCGFVDWADKSWNWNSGNKYVDDETFDRICGKFEARYFYDEISLVPPGVWKQNVIRKFHEIMPKYKRLYDSFSEIDPLSTGGSYGKSRVIDSEFPETMLSGNSDYASRGSDREYEDVTTGDTVEKLMQFVRDYSDIDLMVVMEFEPLFSGLYAVSTNGF